MEFISKASRSELIPILSFMEKIMSSTFPVNAIIPHFWKLVPLLHQLPMERIIATRSEPVRIASQETFFLEIPPEFGTAANNRGGEVSGSRRAPQVHYGAGTRYEMLFIAYSPCLNSNSSPWEIRALPVTARRP